MLCQAEKEGTLLISRGKCLQLIWKPYQNRILVVVVPEGIIIDQLFVNGERQRMARFSNTKAGFQTVDIIQMVNGSRVSAISDFQQFIHSQKSIKGRYLFGILRNQEKINIEFNGELVYVENLPLTN